MKLYSILLILHLSCFEMSCEKVDPILSLAQSDIQIESFHKNKVIAHRGAWKKNGLPENSLASLRNAIDLGCEGSEFDVRMTLDKILVINHDPYYANQLIENTVFPQLAKWKLTNGEELPTLNNFLKIARKQKRTKLMLEIKASGINEDRSIEIADSVVSMVKRLKAEKWLVYNSFNSNILKEIKRLEPMAITLYLNGDKTPEQIYADGLSGISYSYGVYQLPKNKNMIAQALEYNLYVNAWGVTDSSNIQWLLDREVHSITTDEPELLFEILQK